MNSGGIYVLSRIPAIRHQQATHGSGIASIGRGYPVVEFEPAYRRRMTSPIFGLRLSGLPPSAQSLSCTRSLSVMVVLPLSPDRNGV